MDSELTDQNVKNENKYKLAGYCAIASSILTLPCLAVVLLCGVRLGPMSILLPLNISLTVIVISCSFYALYRFKCYLNEYYQFHDIDIYVTLIIILSVIVNVVRVISDTTPAVGTLGLVAVIVLGFGCGLLAIALSVKLLNLPAPLHGMLKPYCYFTIAASICFMLFVLGPIGVILGAVTDFMLGMILLKPKEEIQVEFV